MVARTSLMTVMVGQQVFLPVRQKGWLYDGEQRKEEMPFLEKSANQTWKGTTGFPYGM